MRITILNQFYVPGLAPTGHLAAALAEHRAAHGDRVTVLTSRGGYVRAEAEDLGGDRDNLRVLRVWTPRLGKANALKRILDYAVFYLQAALRLLLMPRQDLIVSLTTPPFIALAAVLHKLLHPATRLVLWNMDCYPEILERTGVIRERGLFDMLLLGLNRAIFKRLDHLVCLDSAMLDLLATRYYPSRAAAPASVIANWEPAALFPPDLQPGRWDVAGQIGISDRFVVLYLGNAGFGHRFESVMEAAGRLQDQDVDFLFVGGGEKWDWIEQEARSRSLNNVHLHPYVPKSETPAVMAAADCALITMNEAALGVISPSKLHANLAMKLPVLYIGPAGSNVDDALRRFEAGASLREGDVDGIVRFIQRLQTDRAYYQHCSGQARLAFDTAYNDGVALPLFDRLIESLANRQAQQA